jgi:hypothetical protein
MLAKFRRKHLQIHVSSRPQAAPRCARVRDDEQHCVKPTPKGATYARCGYELTSRADGGQDERAMSTPGLVADGGGFSRASATARQKRESGALERGLLVRLLGRLIPVGWVTVEQWLECSVEFPAAVDTV